MSELTYTLQGPAIPRTSRPSAHLITTQTLEPPPSAQRTRGEGEIGGVGNRDGMLATVYAGEAGER
jgi:hypothetical protein